MEEITMNDFEFKSEFNCKDLIKDLQSLSVRIHREISYADGTDPLSRAAVTIEALMTALEAATAMNWIKVTPETMPPEMETVFVTILYEDTDEPTKVVWADVRWNKDDGWQYLSNSWDDIWEQVDGEVTHWMPYPKPAED